MATSNCPWSSTCRRLDRQDAHGWWQGVWNWLNNSVHENARRSINALASRAAASTCASRERSIDCCTVRALSRSSRASLSFCATVRPSSVLARRSRHSSTALNTVRPATITATPIRPTPNQAGVVERPCRQVGAEHQAPTTSRCPRSSMPTSGASAAVSAGVIVIRSTGIAACAGRSTRRGCRAGPRGCAGGVDRARPGPRPPSSTRAKPPPIEPILAGHRRLVHHVLRACPRPRPRRGCGRKSGPARASTAIDV